MKVNRHYQALKDNYLFAEVSARTRAHIEKNPDADIIRLGIGDVTKPLCPAVVDAMAAAVAEMGVAETFRGYPPHEGHEFLREAICGYYSEMGVKLSAEEIFVSDGAKGDIANILDLFDADNVVLVPDPVYPVYVDTNIMAGRQVLFMDGNAGNAFLPMPDQAQKADIIYICSPNNPTGAVYDRDGLRAWVDYANKNGAVILFDAAYESFVQDKALPRSIFEIEGAETCAIEFCSLSKTAGFTGTRCGYAVIPTALERDGQNLRKMWVRRQVTKYNGVSYIVQRGAEAFFTPEGRRQCAENIDYYRANAAVIGTALEGLGIPYIGGKHSPYIWLTCPDGMSSWEYFDYMLGEFHVVGTRGAGFGANGEGYFRLTAFGERAQTEEAMRRIAAAKK